MEWSELLTDIFQVCIIPLLGVLTAFFVKWVNAKSAEIQNNIDEANKKVDYTQIKNDVRDSLGKYFYKETEAKPMIITVIQEV